jgi:O-antigen/teichoic acid export membrane protein
VAGREVLTVIFGPFYGAADGVLVVLAVGQIANAYTGSCGLTLLMTGHQKAVMRLASATGVMAVVGGACVATRYGGVGVAVVMAVAHLFQNAGMWWLVRRRVGVRTDARLMLSASDWRDALRLLRG